MTDIVRDPVCGMNVDPERAVASEEHDGKIFYFCSEGCHQAFLTHLHYAHPEEGHR